MYQFLVAVWAGRGRVGELVADALKFQHELLIGLASETAQGGRFVQRNSCKVVRVNIAIADALIVGEDDRRVAGLDFSHSAAVGRLGHPQQVYRVGPKFRHDVQRHHDQGLPALVLLELVAPFELHRGLAKAKPGKDTPAAPAQGPQNAGALVGLQYRVDFRRVNFDAGQRRDVDLVFQKFFVGHFKSSGALLQPVTAPSI